MSEITVCAGSHKASCVEHLTHVHPVQNLEEAMAYIWKHRLETNPICRIEVRHGDTVSVLTGFALKRAQVDMHDPLMSEPQRSQFHYATNVGDTVAATLLLPMPVDAIAAIVRAYRIPPSGHVVSGLGYPEFIGMRFRNMDAFETYLQACDSNHEYAYAIQFFRKTDPVNWTLLQILELSVQGRANGELLSEALVRA